MCVNATEIGTRNYCTVDARPSRMGKVQSSGSFEYIEFYGDMAAHTLWYISYNMYITHTHTHNNRKLFVLADDDIFLFSFSFTTISFSPTTQKKENRIEKRRVDPFVFVLRHDFVHTQTFRLAASKWLFFFGLVFLLFQTCPLIQKRKWSMKKEWKTMKCFTKKCFLSYRMAADNFN